MSDKQHEVRRVLWIVLALNLAVAATKALIGWRIGSLGVIGDAAHSATDGLSNVVGIVAMSVALAPPDADHHYGHRKFETVASLVIAAFIFVTGFEIVRAASERLLSSTGSGIDASWPMIALLVATFFINLFVTLYEARAARRLHSDLLAADAAHTRSDLLVTLSLVVGVVLAGRGWTWIDPLVSLGIALVIMHAGWQVLSVNLPILVDQAYFRPEDLCRAALEVSDVRACYAIRSRGKPGAAYTELTIGVDPRLSVQDAHLLTEAVERRLIERFGPMTIVIHVEPERQNA